MDDIIFTIISKSSNLSVACLHRTCKRLNSLTFSNIESMNFKEAIVDCNYTIIEMLKEIGYYWYLDKYINVILETKNHEFIIKMIEKKDIELIAKISDTLIENHSVPAKTIVYFLEYILSDKHLLKIVNCDRYDVIEEYNIVKKDIGEKIVSLVDEKINNLDVLKYLYSRGMKLTMINILYGCTYCSLEYVKWVAENVPKRELDKFKLIKDYKIYPKHTDIYDWLDYNSCLVNGNKMYIDEDITDSNSFERYTILHANTPVSPTKIAYFILYAIKTNSTRILERSFQIDINSALKSILSVIDNDTDKIKIIQSYLQDTNKTTFIEKQMDDICSVYPIEVIYEICESYKTLSPFIMASIFETRQYDKFRKIVSLHEPKTVFFENEDIFRSNDIGLYDALKHLIDDYHGVYNVYTNIVKYCSLEFIKYVFNKGSYKIYFNTSVKNGKLFQNGVPIRIEYDTESNVVEDYYVLNTALEYRTKDIVEYLAEHGQKFSIYSLCRAYDNCQKTAEWLLSYKLYNIPFELINCICGSQQNENAFYKWVVSKKPIVDNYSIKTHTSNTNMIYVDYIESTMLDRYLTNINSF